MNRIKIREAVIVEGKYDKIRLESVIDALIITTDGFGIFKAAEKRELLRALARERGLLVLTDSDGAGLVIRNFISGCVDPSLVKHAYIPRVEGKERRKSAPSKEGTLGVEGMTREAILGALKTAGIYPCDSELSHGTCGSGLSDGEPAVTRQQLYDDGFIGGQDSAALRRALLARLGLPEYLTTSAMLRVINAVSDKERYSDAAAYVKAERSKSGDCE